MKNTSRDIQRAIATCVLVFTAALGLTACALGQSTQQRMQKARSALSQGHYRTAEIALKNILQKSPKNADAWLMLGRVSLASSQYADAVEQFHRAGNAGISRARIKTPLARALLGNNQYRKVLALLKPASNGSPHDLDAVQTALRGEAYLRMQKVGPAAAAFAQALKKQPEFAPALVGQARLAEYRKKPDRAQQLLDRALKSNPSYALADVARGEFAYRKNRCKAAVGPLRKAVAAPANALAPDRRFMARAYLADCLMRGGKFKSARPQIEKLMAGAPENPYANYLQALLNFRDKDYGQATVHLQRVLKVAPDQVNALTLFGLVKIAQDDTQLAEVYLDQAVHQGALNIVALRLLAGLYIQDNQAQRAIALLKDAHNSYRNDPTITAMLSAALARAGQGSDALHAMQAGGAAMSAHPDLQFNVARVLASAGDSKAATALIDQIKPKNDSGRLQAAKAKIQLQLQQKQNDKALATAKALVDALPDRADAKRVLAITFVAVGQPDDARSLLGKLVDADPHDIPARLDLGLLALREKHYPRAENFFSDVLEQQPKNMNAMLGMARSAAFQNKTNAAIDWLEKAHRAAPKATAPAVTLVQARLANNTAEQAIPVIKALVSAHPKNAAVKRLAGIVLLSAGHKKQALDRFEQAAKLAPGEPAYRLAVARAQLAANQVDDAVKTLKKLRKQHPEFLAAAPTLAMAQLRQGHPDSALAEAQSLSKQANGKVPSAVLEGDVLRAQGQYQAAAKAYERAYTAQPSAALAVTLFEVRRHAKTPHAGASLADWVAKNPNDLRIRLMLAQWQQTRNQLDKAQAQYQRVLKAAPHNVVALNNLALIYAQAHDRRALDMAKKAYNSQPKNAAVMDTLGWLRVENGDIKTGLPLLKRAAHVAASNPDIRYHLAVALAKTGNPQNIAQARTVLKQILDQSNAFDSRSNAKHLSKKLDRKAATAKDG